MNILVDEKRETAQGLNQLEQLRKMTRIAADSGEIDLLKQFQPEDATTNPTLILKATQQPQYHALVEKAIIDARRVSYLPSYILHHLLVMFGTEILKVAPGRVSTETSAKLSFSTQDLIAEARFFISLYAQHHIPRERVLIKLASTWEGIQAAEVLQKEGINCNMTLLFSLVQAAASAEAGAKLISPFVGRILDWHKARERRDFSPAEDPGVKSVREIYAYFAEFGYSTEIMGASFRNVGEILELAGCDLLTISPHLMAELQKSFAPVHRKLGPDLAHEFKGPKLLVSENSFRWLLNENAMATEKLAEGIRIFAADAAKLEDYIKQQLKLLPA